MIVRIDMERLHHGCGESLKVRAGLLLGRARQGKPTPPPGDAWEGGEIDPREIELQSAMGERLCG
jgi:hypothetical protein